MNVYVKYLFILFSFLSHSVKTEIFQSQDAIMSQLSEPLELSKIGFSHFLQHSFNHPEYANSFLPNNFTHLLQLLAQVNNVQQVDFTQAVFRLFTNKLKASSYVNAGRFSDLLDDVSPLIKENFVFQRNHTLDHVEESINALLYGRILEDFAHVQNHPDLFCKNVSQEINALFTAQQAGMSESTMEELRKPIIIFLEIALSKLIWDPQDSIRSWYCAKRIGDQLVQFSLMNIIADESDLNSLLTTLTERYCYFMDLVQKELSLDFYQEIKNDIDASYIAFLDIKEQESYIESKKNHLQRVINNCMQKRMSL